MLKDIRGKDITAAASLWIAREILAIERAKKLFGAEHVNVQPHSGSQANTAGYVHAAARRYRAGNESGARRTFNARTSAKFADTMYKFVPYGVTRETETIDYDEVDRLAREHKPKMIVAGASAYSRIFDFARFAEIAKAVGALLS